MTRLHRMPFITLAVAVVAPLCGTVAAHDGPQLLPHAHPHLDVGYVFAVALAVPALWWLWRMLRRD